MEIDDTQLPLIIKAVDHYNAYLAATKREDSASLELAQTLWQGTQAPSYFASGVSGDASLIQGRFGRTGNFELVVPLASGGLAHYWRDNDNSRLLWHLTADEAGNQTLRRSRQE